MIARIIIPIVLSIVLSDLYIDWHYRRRHPNCRWWMRALWWMPGVLLLGYAVALATIRNFVPDDLMWVNVFMVLIGLVVVPKVLFALCSGVGFVCCRLTGGHRNWGNLLAMVLILGNWYVLAYGFAVGIDKLEVRRVDLYFDNLPDAFEGYRIVQFTDAHVGTLEARNVGLLKRDLDSINAQRPDLIVFTGDLQNAQPQELYPVSGLLASLKARDGVMSVLGNHDYSKYVHASPAVEAANRAETIAQQRRCGWRVLLNEHVVLRRGQDSIVIAGEQNYGDPDSANFEKTMHGVGRQAFIIMLQHNPAAWDATIVPTKRVALTLSGHTHGGQMSVFGWRPTRWIYAEDYGHYERGESQLFVSSGLGGLVPFRFGISPEIVVITLHKTK